ncbi:hypothetical protein SSAG_00898 [Streptomyces sp. Mg1]|nr:hypothetical protein SSAG_00898 [Streptomyces sp. Mg1]
MTLQQSGNLFTEGLPGAAQNRTGQPSYPQVDDDRHVPHRPAVVPVHPRRWRSAHRTRHRHIPSRVRAVTITLSPSSVTSSTTSADSPVPIRELTSITRP